MVMWKEVLHVQRTFGLLVTDNNMQKNSMINNMLYNEKYALDVTNDVIMIFNCFDRNKLDLR